MYFVKFRVVYAAGVDFLWHKWVEANVIVFVW